MIQAHENIQFWIHVKMVQKILNVVQNPTNNQATYKYVRNTR